MKRLYLTPEEKASLEVAHQFCENNKEGERIKAILLRSEDWTVPQISQALRLHQSTIIRHKAYCPFGRAYLRAQSSNRTVYQRAFWGYLYPFRTA